ncbi:MAG: dockerin type I repeat-containing protein [Planctomycetota bacterium]
MGEYALRNRGLRTAACATLLALGVIAPTLARGQYATDFDALVGDADGEVLNGQDLFYNPVVATSTSALVYTYVGNTLGVPANPTGGTQFVGGTGPGTVGAAAVFVRSQRDVTFGAGTGYWEISYDVLAQFNGVLPAGQNLGSVSTQTFPGDLTFIALSTWTDVATATAWNADYVWFDVAGTQLQEIVPVAAFQNLAVNQWYRRTTVFDLDSYRILEVRITDLATSSTASYAPADRYLFGGAVGAPPSDGFRMFAGGAVAGNTMCFDNVTIEEVISACPPIASVTCTVDCAAGEVDLVWPGGAFTAIDIERSGSVIATLAGTATSYTDSPTSGTYTYLVRGVCAGGPALSGPTCTAAILVGGLAENIVWAAELASQIDSAAALSAAMTTAGIAHSVVGDITALPCGASISATNRIWSMLGSFPDNHPLTVDEGTLLQNHVLAGGHLYVESGDTWGFDPDTAFNAIDGIAGGTIDGDDTFLGMIGADFAAGLAAAYSQDQAGNDWTDHLEVAAPGEDLLGDMSAIVWSDDGSGGSATPYNTGVYYDTLAPSGKVLSQSWEFGGYGGDQVALVESYLDVLGGGGPPAIEFRRGDANRDSAFNIADCVFILSALFVPGSPSPSCADAADLNDDGLVNIADAVFGLSSLFVPGSPPPSAPGPATCGADPTADAIGCAAPC